MPDKKPFSDSRWNDASMPKVIGHVELTPKDKKEAREKLSGLIKSMMAKRK